MYDTHNDTSAKQDTFTSNANFPRLKATIARNEAANKNGAAIAMIYSNRLGVFRARLEPSLRKRPMKADDAFD
jgi:hypothetical protein